MRMTIIKNYEMPHNCYDCDLHNYHECDLTSESIEEDYCWNGDSREKHCPLREVDAIPRADYENRLKADLVAAFTDLQLEIVEMDSGCGWEGYRPTAQIIGSIQQRINDLAVPSGLEKNSKKLEKDFGELDCINRSDLLKAMDTWDKFGYTETGCFVREPKGAYVPYVRYEDMVNCVKDMPSVIPEK